MTKAPSSQAMSRALSRWRFSSSSSGSRLMPNRRGFLRQLEVAIDRVSRYDDTAAMLFIDLDGLKMINDTFGHQAGDQALIQVAEVLLDGIRKSDCVARLGGDEFAVLLERADEAKAIETAERLVSMITHCEFCFQGMCLPLSVAIGVAVVEPNDTPEACMKIRNSLKSLKSRHRDCRVIRRRGRTYVINKTNRRFKARQG